MPDDNYKSANVFRQTSDNTQQIENNFIIRDVDINFLSVVSNILSCSFSAVQRLLILFAIFILNEISHGLLTLLGVLG